MILKTKERNEALILRKQGLSLNEIKKQVKVAKSTLSLWLRDVGLSKPQKQRLTEKKLAAAKRGALKRKNERIESTFAIKKLCRNEIGKISKRELWLIGIALYWAEGSKQKEHYVSQTTNFTNSDPQMLRLFLSWLKNIVKISDKDIKLEIYTHEGYSVGSVVNYWAKELSFPKEVFKYVYFKKGNPKTKRKNVGEKYHGLIHIKVRGGTVLNRKLSGWAEGIVNNCEVV